ncbi:MAG: PHP domain-containing protein [Firmicutes bacterium]|nr:PHP domain-containing protein [Bacillota bacterium]
MTYAKDGPGSSRPGAEPGHFSSRFYDHRGALHIHTRYSDGSGTIGEVIAAALQTGLDYIILTDHNNLDGKASGAEGWYGRKSSGGKMLVLVGTEVSPPGQEGNHLLSMGIDHVPRRNPADMIEDTGQQGGIGFLAHPDDQPRPIFNSPGYPWRRWDLDGFTGMEVWNFFSSWSAGLDTLPKVISAYLFPGLAAAGPPAESLARWDLLGLRRRITGVGGIDAHALKIRLGPLTATVFPYRYMLGTVNTHLLTRQTLCGDLSRDQNLILEALASGRCYLADHRSGDPSGFSFWLECASGETAAMGEEAPFEPGMILRGMIPLPAQAVLIKDGGMVRRWCSEGGGEGGNDTQRGRGERRRRSRPLVRTNLEFPLLGPGVYRLEVYRTRFRRPRPWIFSNPVYIRPRA